MSNVSLSPSQDFKAKQIKGFVNRTLKGLHIVHDSKGITEYEAMLVIQAALHAEKDTSVVSDCEQYFKENYNYQK